MYYHFYLSPFIFSCKESFNSSSFLKFEILISWASSPLGYAYYILKKNYVACIYNGSIFFQIICTFIKLIFVIFASVEIPVRD